MLRTNTCGELKINDVDRTVKLCGWIHSIRDHGGISFIDLRDKYGITQIVFNGIDEHLSRETVIQVEGTVRKRDEETYNSKIPTGEIEVFATKLEILNESAVIPFDVSDNVNVSDEVRLKYRFIDLRRPVMQENLRFRHMANLAMRKYLTQEGFIEVETPLLVRSTPEGARDYVVPSRVSPGKFYALPQSPQIYKQILMVGGTDKYFQFAKCLRDEDLRADRQPEFTQLDVEMSFVEQEDIFRVAEGAVKSVFTECLGKELETPFQKLSYTESMQKYGSDKPDLRFGLEITDVTEIMKKSEFSVFNAVIASGGKVKMLNPEFELGRNEFDSYISFVQSIGGKGMAWMKVTPEGLDSNIVKYFSEDVQKEILSVSKQGSLLFIADTEKKALEIAGKLRLKVAEDKNLIDKSKFCFAWIVDFPSFEWNEDTDRWDPAHHMFTMPKKECLQYLEDDNLHPEKVLADCYDMVLNGVELASGSIRICNPDIQRKVMNVISYSDEEIQEKFGFMLNAFRYGAPPHGGFAIGFDRFIAMLRGFLDIREVIAFPKTKSAESLLDGCPSEIKDKQLKELKLKLDFVKKQV
ncbi:aspartate--tRNA ligase [Candidatus Woesearchaeota archaeon]|nr:aspartate--tRNA ligase [Candidatus Woesearchaeota archaeon]